MSDYVKYLMQYHTGIKQQNNHIVNTQLWGLLKTTDAENCILSVIFYSEILFYCKIEPCVMHISPFSFMLNE